MPYEKRCISNDFESILTKQRSEKSIFLTETVSLPRGSFHAVMVFGLGPEFFFKSILACFETLTSKKVNFEIVSYD